MLCKAKTPPARLSTGIQARGTFARLGLVRSISFAHLAKGGGLLHQAVQEAQPPITGGGLCGVESVVVPVKSARDTAVMSCRTKSALFNCVAGKVWATATQRMPAALAACTPFN